ncbi:hypothetical protein EYF80_061557 [Liparis tanakae]|uniref:Uncharacterized protein n=1 Tax=Liparis tanakae TaxID=230148 RepID=A0A4Z2EHA2_9TELE|nr:hypothetical protein EYF80_061557 [Liparis tanakae]
MWEELHETLTGSRSEKSLSTFAFFPFLLRLGASSSSSSSSSSSISAPASSPAARGASPSAGGELLSRSSSARLSSGIRVPRSRSRQRDKVATTAPRVWAWRAAGRLSFMFHSVPEGRSRRGGA